MCEQHVEISIWDVGDQTIRTREEVPPDPHPSCKPAGGRREVKTRLEEPGGGWRMEVLYNPFDFMQNCLIFNQFGSRVE